MPNILALDPEHPSVRSVGVEREEATARAATTGSHAMLAHDTSGSRVTMEIDPEDRRVSVGRNRNSPTWLLALALLGGGGAGGAVGSFGLGGSEVEAEVAQARAEIAGHKARLDAHDAVLKESTDDITNTQRWLGDVLVKQSAALADLASAVGVKVDVTVPQLISEGRR